MSKSSGFEFQLHHLINVCFAEVYTLICAERRIFIMKKQKNGTRQCLEPCMAVKRCHTGKLHCDDRVIASLFISNFKL